jgi:hypothetical protein
MSKQKNTKKILTKNDRNSESSRLGRLKKMVAAGFALINNYGLRQLEK